MEINHASCDRCNVTFFSVYTLLRIVSSAALFRRVLKYRGYVSAGLIITGRDISEKNSGDGR